MTCWTDGKPATARDVPALAGASEIQVGTSVCGEVDHGVVCWNPEGGDAGASTDTPVAVAGLTDATHLVACNNAAWTCAHRSNGHVVCWGQHDQTIDRVPVDIGTHDRPMTSTTGSCWGSWHDAPAGTTFDGDSPMYGGREWSCTKGPHGGCSSQLSSGTDTTPKGGYGAFDDARDLRPSVHGELLCEADARGAVSCLDLANDGKPARRVAVRGVRDAIQLAAYDGRVCALERAGSVVCWSEGGGARARAPDRRGARRRRAGRRLRADLRAAPQRDRELLGRADDARRGRRPRPRGRAARPPAVNHAASAAVMTSIGAGRPVHSVNARAP